jgi:hypothetical protein
VFSQICALIGKDPDNVLRQFRGKLANDGVINPRKVMGETRKQLNPVNLSFPQQEVSLVTCQVSFSMSDLKKNTGIPSKMSALLAEEVGMHLGDGFLSGRRYEYRLKGNKHDETEYYQYVVKSIFKNLYNIDLVIKHYDSTCGFELHSKAIHEFKAKVLGLPCGRKDAIRIPEAFKINDLPVLSSLLRGLYDTDGNVHFHTKYGLKSYYPCVSLTQKSERLILDVSEILKMIGFLPSLHHDKRGYWTVNLWGYQALQRFIKQIGFHNPKHTRKIHQWRALYPQLSLWRS